MLDRSGFRPKWILGDPEVTVIPGHLIVHGGSSITGTPLWPASADWSVLIQSLCGHIISCTCSSRAGTFVTADTILVRDSEPAFVTLQDNVVLLSVESGAYFRFNSAGSKIWNMLAQPRRVGEIFQALAEIHDVDRDIMTNDIVNFLDALLDRHLVRVVNPVTVA